jgi:hypothetical protein
VFLLSSCSDEDSEMDRTIFIPDETHDELPAYTEWGYNTFGAVYDVRDYFVVSNQVVPCKILYKDGLLRFSLSGILQGNYYTVSEKVTLSFSFPLDRPANYADLLSLNNMKLEFPSNDCTVKFTRGDNEKILDIVSGNLYFKRAQLLYIDDAVNRVILSGTFELRFLEDDFPVAISNGRFDLGINDNVFFAY